MKKETIIENIFNVKALSYEYIETGLTNDNYVVTLPDQKVVLRIPRIQNQGLFNYELESKVLNEIKPLNLEPNLIYYNKLTGVKCSEYIENSETFNISYIERSAILIRKLHDANIQTGVNFNIKDKFHMYKERVQHPLFDTDFAHHVIDNLKVENVRLCHNDIVAGNLLFSDTKDHLIDFEYAADNDPFFDIMSFITENDITNPQLRNTFYWAYFERNPTAQELDRLHKFEIVHHVLWCEWAMMMYELHHHQIYIDIASLKYKRLIECTKKAEF